MSTVMCLHTQYGFEPLVHLSRVPYTFSVPCSQSRGCKCFAYACRWALYTFWDWARATAYLLKLYKVIDVRGKTTQDVLRILCKLRICEAQDRAAWQRPADAGLANTHSYALRAPPLVQQISLLLCCCLPSILHECVNAPENSSCFCMSQATDRPRG